MVKKRTDAAGPWLVACAAILWATDALFRVPAVSRLHPTFIVAAEHAIGLGILLPWVLLRRGRQAFALRAREWTALLFIGAGASALATVLFTGAFRAANPSVVILLQKIQPVIVVALAVGWLGERPPRGYWIWGPIALAAAFVLTFPDFGRQALAGEGWAGATQGALQALSAAAIWAGATVVGRKVLSGAGPAKRQGAPLPPDVATFWRLAFGLVAAAGLAAAAGADAWPSADLLTSDPALPTALAYMAAFPGLLALLAYYSGLRRTPAAVATLVELLFPLSAVALNAWLLGARLEPAQLAAGAALLFAVTRVSLAKR